jgi:hypothetical protein
VPGADDEAPDEVASFWSTPDASELSVFEVSVDVEVESGAGSEELPIRTIFLRRELEASLPSPPAAGLDAEKKRPGRCEKYEYGLVCVGTLKAVAADARNWASIRCGCWLVKSIAS